MVITAAAMIQQLTICNSESDFTWHLRLSGDPCALLFVICKMETEPVSEEGLANSSSLTFHKYNFTEADTPMVLEHQALEYVVYVRCPTPPFLADEVV